MCDADSLPVLTSVHDRPAIREARYQVCPAADYGTCAWALHSKAVLVLDEYLAAALFEFLDELVHQVGVLHVPLGRVEVARHLGVALMVRLEPRGIQAALLAGQVSGNPGDVHVRTGSWVVIDLHLLGEKSVVSVSQTAPSGGG